jgi:integrase
MSLKVVSRPGTATLYLRGTVRRQSVFESTGTSDPERAEGLRAKREAELWDRSVYGARAVVTFAHAVASYLDEEPRPAKTRYYLAKLLKHFGTIHLSRIDQEALDGAYRALQRPDASNASKMRAVRTPLRAVLEHAAIRRWCERPAFKTLKSPKSTTPFLLPHQATALVHAASPHLRPLLVFQIGTGCRMSEALALDWAHVDLLGARAVVWQKQDTERLVDLPPVVVAALSALPHRDGAVFRRPWPEKKKRQPGWQGYALQDREGGGQIGTAWATACGRAGLPGEMKEWVPKGKTKPLRRFVPAITPHVMRHTWASWDNCIHKDLKGTQERGGWETITMVSRYAKRMPEAHRQAAIDWLAGRALSVQASDNGENSTIAATG